MPLDKEMIEKAIQCLDSTTVNSFTATPSTIRPGVASTLKWEVTAPVSCGVNLFLNNSSVSKTGSRSVAPTNTTTYRLVGKMGIIERILGTVTVSVDKSQCFIQSIDEATVRQMLQSLIESNLAGSPLRQRSPANVEIDRKGIAVKLRLKVSVPNFFDPDLNIDIVIGVSAASNSAVVSYRSYSNDLDWPWWVTGITLGITKLIEEVIESRIERGVKPLILQKLKEQIDSFIRFIPPTHSLHSLTTEDNEVRGLVCPVS
mgnify:CR=1 FL=1